MSGSKSIAFVVSHPYVDAVACFREPIRALADAGWQVDLYTRVSPKHGAPVFPHPRVRLVPIDVTVPSTVAMVAALVRQRPPYQWIVAPPQWSLHYASVAAKLIGAGLVCISDELMTEAQAATPVQKKWKARERRAHQRCSFTIALSEERAEFIRGENQLGAAHPMFVVPNSAPGPSVRLRSRYYQDALCLDSNQFVVLHSGSWWWRLQFGAVTDVTKDWDHDAVLVFQGRLQADVEEGANPRVRFSQTILPSALLDYATSSAHVGLALYATSDVGHGRIGTASGKIALYMKNRLPVITTAQPSLEWIEREGCGVCVSDTAGIADAVRRVRSDYNEYCARIPRVYDARWNFARAFEPVMARLERGA
jgi:hypothetical protein